MDLELLLLGDTTFFAGADFFSGAVFFSGADFLAAAPFFAGACLEATAGVFVETLLPELFPVGFEEAVSFGRRPSAKLVVAVLVDFLEAAFLAPAAFWSDVDFEGKLFNVSPTLGDEAIGSGSSDKLSAGV